MKRAATCLHRMKDVRTVTCALLRSSTFDWEGAHMQSHHDLRGSSRTRGKDTAFRKAILCAH